VCILWCVYIVCMSGMVVVCDLCVSSFVECVWGVFSVRGVSVVCVCVVFVSFLFT